MCPVSNFLCVSNCKRYVQAIRSGNEAWDHLIRASGPVVGVCERSNEHMCFIIIRGFLYSVSVTFSKMEFLYGIRKFHWRSSVNVHQYNLNKPQSKGIHGNFVCRTQIYTKLAYLGFVTSRFSSRRDENKGRFFFLEARSFMMLMVKD